MGLGKTLQAISLLSYLRISGLSNGPFLILCPLSVTDGWMSEFNKFCPSMKVLQYVGDKEHRRSTRRMMCEHVKRTDSSSSNVLPFDVLLTTYDIAIADQVFLSQIPWGYAVIDEAQRLKNPASVLYKTLQQHFVIPRRLLLTGTPIQNNLSELWSLMKFCMPGVFGMLEDFLATFKEAEGEEHGKARGQLRILKYVLKAFMLRRTKAMLIDSGILTLPPLTELTVMVPLVPLQKKLYLSVMRKELQTLLSLAKGSSGHQSLQNIVIQLRKACSHPYLFSGIEPEPHAEGEHLVEASGKLVVLDMLLKKLHELGHRVLLFAQMTQTLDILQDFLEFRKYTYDRLDGSVRAEERFAAIRSFSTENNKGDGKHNSGGPFVFMISTRAGGVGLNLVGADTVIFYEQDWNPQADKQALQRAHRIGQLNHVLSINLVTEHSIEEVIMRRAKRKLELSHNVIGDEDELGGTKADESVEAVDMRSLIFGLHIFDPMDAITDTLEEKTMMNLRAMASKVVGLREKEDLGEEERMFEINPTNIFDKKMSDSVCTDPGIDEASYLSWVEKFKETFNSTESVDDELLNRRRPPEEKERRREVDKIKAEEKRAEKWKAHGYESLAVKEPDIIVDQHLLSVEGTVQYVLGDCTDPFKNCASKAAIILSCVDTSGTWGRGGMFSALERLSASIPDAYHRASEYDDLHMGDLHLIELDESKCSCKDGSLWVALAVVQSYNQRRKVPRGDISLPDLESCVSKAAFTASQHSASIHMPRIGYQDGSQRSEWYAIERLLRKHAALHKIDIFVYYYRRPRNRQADE